MTFARDLIFIFISVAVILKLGAFEMSSSPYVCVVAGLWSTTKPLKFLLEFD
jgi:hypothetical protein